MPRPSLVQKKNARRQIFRRRSFSEVLFLMMIVVDRALYTWYRCDHIREDECGQVKDSWTWKAGWRVFLEDPKTPSRGFPLGSLWNCQQTGGTLKRTHTHTQIKGCPLLNNSCVFFCWRPFCA